MRFDVITTFPEMFTPLRTSIVGRAVEQERVQIEFVNPRDFSEDPHRKTDDEQYGGGEGMVMTAPPLLAAVESVQASPDKRAKEKLLFMSPQGRLFDQSGAKELSGYEHVIIIAGHYKGVDQRCLDLLQPEEISIGDYVLTGGEIPAMAIIDAVVRLLPGVVGGFSSVSDDSLYEGLLDCPRYTRPREVRGLSVPAVLLGGNHGKIEAWRRRMAIENTRQKRPDLLARMAGGD